MAFASPSPSAVITAQLESFRGKRVSILLDDQRHVLGVLQSYDNFANICVSGAVDARYALAAGEGGGQPALVHEEPDDPRGTLIFRGTHVVCIGLVDTLAEAQGTR